MAILDADLTIGLPRHITAATGIDAMVHAIEAYTGKRFKNPVSDALALAAMKKLHGALERSLSGRVGSRRPGPTCCWARCWRGQAFSNSPVGWGARHGLSAGRHVPRAARAVQLGRPCRRFCASTPVRQKTLYGEIAGHIGLKASSAALISEMERIADAVGIERRLSELGISHNDIPAMAEDVAAMTGSCPIIPGPWAMTISWRCMRKSCERARTSRPAFGLSRV